MHNVRQIHDDRRPNSSGPPLFRGRNKQHPIYCHSETERGSAAKQLGGKPEITPFKGLGEISQKEFAQFIGKEMGLSKVEYAPKLEAAPGFDFYMGKNTPERKDYIINHPVFPVENQGCKPPVLVRSADNATICG